MVRKSEDLVVPAMYTVPFVLHRDAVALLGAAAAQIAWRAGNTDSPAMEQGHKRVAPAGVAALHRARCGGEIPRVRAARDVDVAVIHGDGMGAGAAAAAHVGRVVQSPIRIVELDDKGIAIAA